MKVLTSIADYRQQLAQWRQQKNSIGLVTTMGNLHKGHLSLVDIARQHSDKIVVSIFVNPMQFGANEDLATYPRTFEQDCDALRELGVDTIFAPVVSEIYPQDISQQTIVSVPGLSDELCGVTRPQFFYGITTVVAKLFNIIQPDVAVYGEKDYQQLVIIKTMVEQLNYPITILSGPIVREDTGLAMSSRNNYLTEEQRQTATQLYQALMTMANEIQNGSRVFDKLIDQAKQKITNHGFKPDYISIRRQQDLMIANKDDKQLIILAAAWLAKTRLIDNFCVNL